MINFFKKNIFLVIIFVFFSMIFIFSRFTYNVTNSLRKGIYFKKFFPEYKKNNLVLFELDKKYLKYLENFPNKNKLKKIYLIKRIVGVCGDKIENRNGGIFINGEKKGEIFKIKGLNENKNKNKNKNINKSIKTEESYVLKKDEFFVMGDTPTSFDSRYFGVLKKKDFKFEMKLLIDEKTLEKIVKYF